MEEALDLSFDRLLMMMMMMRYDCIYKVMLSSRSSRKFSRSILPLPEPKKSVSSPPQHLPSTDSRAGYKWRNPLTANGLRDFIRRVFVGSSEPRLEST